MMENSEQKHPAVSVIVAVFNAETTLNRCLDSLCSQTLNDIEVILVDDGSTDQSPSICDQYAQSDTRFKVFHKANEGVSPTRQFGLDRVSGEYVIHLDADDYVEPDAYKTLYDCAIRTNAAIVCCNYFRITPSGIHAVNNTKGRYSLTTKLKDVFFRQNGFLWNHLIARDLILRHPVFFPPEIPIGEDQFFIIGILTKCKYQNDPIRIASCRAHLVYYDKTANPQSLTALNPQKRFWARFNWWKTVYDQIYLKQEDCGSFYKRLVDDSFCALWNNIIDEVEIYHALKPYFADIKHYAPFSPQKYLTLLVCQGKYKKARQLKYLGSFRIIRDKLEQVIARFPSPKELR